MPDFVSPGNYVIEKDISDYVPTINSSVVGIVGFASKGPISGQGGERPTLITSQENLIRTFGRPDEDIPGQALEGALEILEATDSIRFVRCASGALNASASVSMGACPGIYVSAAPHGMLAMGTTDAGVSSVRFTVNVWDDVRTQLLTTKRFTVAPSSIGASADYATGVVANITAVKRAVGGTLESDKIQFISDVANTSGFFTGAAAGSGAYMNITVEVLNADGVTWNPPPVNAGVGIGSACLVEVLYTGELAAAGASATTASGSTMVLTGAADGFQYHPRSLFPGEGYNAGTRADGTTSGNSFEVNVRGGNAFAVQVNDEGTAAENFKCTLTSGEAFIENQIGIDVTSQTSEHIFGNIANAANADITATALPDFVSLQSALTGDAAIDITDGGKVARVNGNPRFIKLVQGTYNLAAGTNGAPTSTADRNTTLIGTVESDGGKTGIEALDDDLLNISMALIPGFQELQSTQNALVTKAEGTQDFLALGAPPYAVGRVQDAIEWHNGLGTDRTAAINSSYVALYWPWVKVFSVFDGKDRWYDPTIYGARQMAVTDSVAEPWFAPAGYVRARLTKPTETEVRLNQGDRNSLYSGGNVINPIANFPQTGIVIFGQRTAQRSPTALDRINVRRLLIVLRKQLLASTRRLVFEPNDAFTWSRVEQLLNPLLDDIKRRRGITEFKVVCNQTTNTPIRIDRNEMWCKILLKPTKVAEVVVFELNITSQSAQLGTL